MKTNRLLTVLVGLILLLVFSTGCSDKTNQNTVATPTQAPTEETTQEEVVTEESEEPLEPVTLTVLVGNLTIDPSESTIMKELTEMTGVTLDYSISIANSDVAVALPLMLAGNDLPDIVLISDADLRTAVLDAGVATPLDDLVADYGPNMQDIIGDALALSKLLRSDETNALYFLPTCNSTDKAISATTYTDKGWSIRWDLYKELGCPPVDTVDQYFDVLLQMMELEPETADGQKTYGFGGFFGESWGYVIPGNAIKSMMGYVQLGTMPIEMNMNTGEPQGIYTDVDSPTFRMLEYWNKAYRMGVIDPESITLKFSEYQEIAAGGRYLSTVISWMGATTATQNFYDNGETEKGYVPIKVGVEGASAYVYQTDYLGGQGNYFISTSCQAPDRAISVFDYLVTQEGYMLVSYGIEGENYTYDDDGYVENLMPASLTDEQKLETGLGLNAGLLCYRRTIEKNPKTIWDALLPVQQDYCEYFGYSKPVDCYKDIEENTYDTSLGMSASLDPDSYLVDVEAEIQAYLQVAIPKLIFQETEEDFETYKQEMFDTLTSMEYLDLVDYYLNAYADAKAALESIS